jgi:hypothetical protein
MAKNGGAELSAQLSLANAVQLATFLQSTLHPGLHCPTTGLGVIHLSLDVSAANVVEVQWA